MGIYKYPRTYNKSTKKYSYRKNRNVSLSAHFKVYEFRSKDGADEIVICPYLIEGLEKLFKHMKAKAINITSGYRSISHSKAVGGAGAKDNHHLGMAADIKVKKQNGTYYTAKEVACALQDMGWEHGIGLMNTSVHMDCGSKYWFDETKRSNGAYVQVADWHKYTGIKAPATTKPATKPSTKPSTATPAKKPAHRGTAYILTCDKLYIRKRATTLSKKVGTLYRGQKFYVVKWKGNWAYLEGGGCTCAKKYSRKKP